MQTPEFLTPADVAKILKISVDSVIRKFSDRPGVIDIGSEEKRHKRRYRVLRIPRESFDKFVIENKVQ